MAPPGALGFFSPPGRGLCRPHTNGLLYFKEQACGHGPGQCELCRPADGWERAEEDCTRFPGYLQAQPSPGLSLGAFSRLERPTHVEAQLRYSTATDSNVDLITLEAGLYLSGGAPAERVRGTGFQPQHHIKIDKVK